MTKKAMVKQAGVRTERQVPFVQLPIDLQRAIHAEKRLDLISGPLAGGRLRSLLLSLIAVAAAAAIAAGLDAALTLPAGPFERAGLWLPLVLGALVLGAIIGEDARLDVRHHGVNGILVSTTTLVLIHRDSVTILPAEGVTIDGTNWRYRGRVVVRSQFSNELEKQLQNATRAAADPAACAADRWWSQTLVTTNAPVWRFMPIAHGAVLGLASAVAIEAAVPSEGGSSAIKKTIVADNQALQDDWARRTKEVAQAKLDGALKGEDSVLLTYIDDAPDPESVNKARAEYAKRLTARLADETDLTRIQNIIQVAQARKLAPELIQSGRAKFAEQLHKVSDSIDARTACDFISDQIRLGLSDDDVLMLARHADTLLTQEIGKTDDVKDLLELNRLLARTDPGDRLLPTASAQLARRTRTALAAARTLDDVDALAKFVEDDSAVQSAYRAAINRQVAATSDIDELSGLGTRVEELNMQNLAYLVTDKASRLLGSRLASSKTPGDLAEVESYASSFFDDDVAQRWSKRVHDKGLSLAMSAPTVSAASEWMDWSGFDEDESERVKKRIESLCKSTFPHRSNIATIARELCIAGSEEMGYYVIGDEDLAEGAAAAVASDVRAYVSSRGVDSLIVPRPVRHGWQVKVEVSFDDDEHAKAESEARVSGKEASFACKVSYTLPDDKAWNTDGMCVTKITYQKKGRRP